MQGTSYDTCTHISSKHDLFNLKLKEVWQYRELIALFTKRSFKVAYMQTILGPLWLFINPMLTSITHLIVFGNIAKLGTDGIPQLLFYFSGNAIWTFFRPVCTTMPAHSRRMPGCSEKYIFPDSPYRFHMFYQMRSAFLYRCQL